MPPPPPPPPLLLLLPRVCVCAALAPLRDAHAGVRNAGAAAPAPPPLPAAEAAALANASAVDKSTKGVPGFWLHALKNHPDVAQVRVRSRCRRGRARAGA